jgi:peptidoglycan/LPS O-acetylase OafA/YrhL
MASSPLNTSTTRIPQLDGLRGIAILLVIFWHYYMNGGGNSSPFYEKKLWERLLSLSWSGVDLFFVLSGFLIGGILMEKQKTSNYFRIFYLRRFCRIFPLYFALLFSLGGFLYFCWPPDILAPQSQKNAYYFLTGDFHKVPWWSYPLFLQNFFLTYHNQFDSTWLSVTWSLAIEEQFYLVLPLLIRFIPPSRLPYVLILLIFVAPVFRLFCLYFNILKKSSAFRQG